LQGFVIDKGVIHTIQLYEGFIFANVGEI